MPEIDLAVRAQIVTLKEINWTNEAISKHLSVLKRSIQSWYSTVCKRGYNPAQSKCLKLDWLKDEPRSGRLTKQTPENEADVLKIVRDTRDTRTLSCIALSRRLLVLTQRFVSYGTIYKILRAAGFHKVKPTKKPGLTPKIKQDRLKWCKAHVDWTLDDWKKVLWTDETSVCFGSRRGGEKVWRTAEEKQEKTCLRSRWKGFSEFMF